MADNQAGVQRKRNIASSIAHKSAIKKFAQGQLTVKNSAITKQQYCMSPL